MNNAIACLLGQAFGDALGAPTEFLKYAEIAQRFSPNGPQAPTGDPIRVTDDTQMMLAVGQALAAAERPVTPENLERHLRQFFVEWLTSPDNNRAPGVTCLRACQNLKNGLPWIDATVRTSKGAGANMRVAPVGLFAHAHHLDRATCAAMAQFQAALTHGHATGLAAADLTAYVIVELVAQTSQPDELIGKLRVYAEEQRTVYHEQWLGTLWDNAYVNRPQDFIARGWDECIAALNRVEPALHAGDTGVDPCELTGAGWIAEEALATGLLCFLFYPDDPVAAIRRAAFTSGDSDTIASLTGAFAGAYNGLAAWPADWVDRIEYRAQLLALGQMWD